MTSLTQREVEIAGFLASASPPEIAAWLHARMHGTDTAGGGRDEAPRALVERVYRVLSFGSRSDVRLAALAALTGITDGPEEWTDEAGAELLLLADPIFVDVPLNTSHRAEILEMLARLAEPAQHKLRDRPSVRVAATQALLSLDAKPVPRFWFRLYDEYGPTYAPLVVEALARSDLSALTKWLLDRLPDTALQDALLNLLPFMLHKHGSGPIAAAIRPLRARLTPDAAEELEELAEAISLDLGTETPLANIGSALSHALRAISHLLAAPMVDITDSLRQTVVSAILRTREALNDPRSLSDETKWELLDKYLGCIDRAIGHPRLVQVVLPELTHGLAREAVSALAAHLVNERGIPRELVETIAGELPVDLPPYREHPLDSFPEALRGYLLVEVSLVLNERNMRDQLTQADVGWFDELMEWSRT